ncbi:MAG: hypothetical protein WBO58_09005 [Gammaproteobacteria bacterium]
MNLALERYADNPIIDELVCWPPRPRRMNSIRAGNVLFRKPFIEVEMEGGEIFQRQFERNSFAESWAEACVILETMTDIELISEFSFAPVPDRSKLVADVLANRDECIEECNQMYDEGMYAQFLMQFGEDCTNLPQETLQRIDEARQRLGLSA